MDAALCGQSSARIEAKLSIGDTGGELIHDHIAGAGIKGEGIREGAALGQHGQVADAADILQADGGVFVPIEQKLRIGHQRCALSAGGHIAHAEIADDGASECLIDIGRLAHLQGARNFIAEVRGGGRLVPQGLTVTAHEVDFLR